MKWWNCVCARLCGQVHVRFSVCKQWRLHPTRNTEVSDRWILFKNKNKKDTSLQLASFYGHRQRYLAVTSLLCSFSVCLWNNKDHMSSPLPRIQRWSAALDGQQGRGLPCCDWTWLKAAGGQQVPLWGGKRPRECLRFFNVLVLRVWGQHENRRHTQECARGRQVRKGAVAPDRRRQFVPRWTDLRAVKLSRIVYVNHRPAVQGNVSQKQQSRASLPRVFGFSRMRVSRTSAERTARSSRHSPLRRRTLVLLQAVLLAARENPSTPTSAHWWSDANYGN